MPPTATETVAETVASLSLRSTESQVKDQVGATESPIPAPAYRYEHLLPVFDPSEKFPPVEPFTHVDPGSRALTHSDPRSFLQNATVTELTPVLGTEVTDVDLLSLDTHGRDQLALEVARRKVVVFRNQEAFVNAHPDKWIEWGSYFGRLDIHPTSGHPAGYPELHLVYRDGNSTFNYERDEHLSTSVVHSDVSYQPQPPGLTAFWLLAQPKTGGDTLFISQTATLKRFSEPFVAFLRTLYAVHSGVAQANYSRSGKRGGVVRREPIETEHPIVRRHPVTGEEALYVNFQFTTRIVGLKKEESDNLLNFLYDAVAKSYDSQLRIKWQPNTVVVWDNRVTAHSAIVDFAATGERRHGARLAAHAEKPIPASDPVA